MIERVARPVAPEVLAPRGPASERASAPEGRGGFAEMLESQLEAVNRLQARAEEEAQSLARGEVENLHQVMITAEKAQLALELTVAIRNKVLEAYQEISRMQL
ncbi:flagellar hook-basal body complex protein FliE [Limnochorda pilosa]|uniref:Flagellar hook-basal body complex protein FliE n=1 Tax=Limnochorda pilosa TaxID=1555112 RepID=A0A0K2SK52_LIMPI|nr:flagellar hook-basal body complex protein FliE [Limnochorda pilosa]BAS27496.1 flagellar hook-basal body protein FliE [Limnochorda pilosa]